VRRGGQAIVLSSGRSTPKALAVLLNNYGRGDSEFTVLEQLGGPNERHRDGTAREWAGQPAQAQLDVDDLNVIAIRYLPDERVSSLPDDYRHDGRSPADDPRGDPGGAGAAARTTAVDVARLRKHRRRVVPQPSRCTAVAFERDERRQLNVGFNAAGFRPRHRRPRRRAAGVRRGSDPQSSSSGGLTQPGLLDACLDHLSRADGSSPTRHAESESTLAQAYSSLGGQLRRFQHYQGEPGRLHRLAARRCRSRNGR